MSIKAAELFISVNADTRQGEQGLTSFNSKMNNAAKNMTMTGAALTAGVTLPLLAIGKAALDSAMDFEQNMNVLQQVSGASTDTMSALTAEALRLGAVTSFSAGEAAEGMLELAKAGMSTEEIMASIGGVMDLAAAGGIGLAEAAAITAAALNAFHLEASESGRVANLLAAAANASAADISDLSQGMQQAGFAFAMANQPIDNLAASLAILTNVGLTGSDAGTALKNAFMRMMNPTAEASALMQELNINFYDAAGNMKALPDIIDMLNVATGGLTNEQRDAALSTIFLSDGMKAMIPLMAAGKGGFNEMLVAVNQAGAATDVAGARMKGLSGGIEYLKGSVDSFMIGAALPFLSTLGGLARGAGDLLSQFGALPLPIINATLAFAGILAAIGPLLLVLGGLTAALASPLLPIALLFVGIAALSAAWIANVGGIQEITATAFGGVVTALQDFGKYISFVVKDGDYLNDWLTHLPSATQPAVQALGQGISILQDFGRYTLAVVSDGDYLNDWLTHLPSAMQPATRALGQGIAALQDLMTAAKDVDLKGLWGDTTQIATSLTGQLKVGLAMEVDWSQLRVNAEGMVTRAGERLSAIDWTSMSVNFGGLLSTAGAEITKQADKYLGADNLVSRTVASITGVLATLKTTFEGASFDAPLDLFSKTVTGVVAIMGLISGVKSDATTTAITTLQSLLASVLNFATSLVAGVDPALIAKAATGYVTGMTDQVVAAMQPDKLLALGTAMGSFAAMLITKLGDTFADPQFGTDVGTAVGEATAAFATGALALAAGIVGELSKVEFTTLIPQIQTFTSGFISGVAAEIGKGDYAPMGTAILTGLATAIRSLIEANPLNMLSPGDWFNPVTDNNGVLMPTVDMNSSDALGGLDWSTWITAIDWTEFVTEVLWTAFVPAVPWIDFVPMLSWGSFIPDIDWGSFIPDFLGGSSSSVAPIEPQAEGSSLRGTRFAMAGAGGGNVHIHVNANVSNDFDLEVLASKLATKFKQKMR